MRTLKKSQAANVMIFMTSSSDHVTGASGLSLSVYLSKNGGSFGIIGPAITDRGYGWYNIALGSGETNTLGDLALHITGAGADPTDVLCLVTDMASDVWQRIIDGGYTAEELIRLVSAVIHGDATGLESGSPVFKSLDGTKDRVTGTLAAGVRTISGRDPS